MLNSLYVCVPSSVVMYIKHYYYYQKYYLADTDLDILMSRNFGG